MPEIAVGIRPFVPYPDTLVPEASGRWYRPARNHKQLVDDAFQMHLLVVTRGNPSARLNPHLIAERGDCAGAGAVLPFRTPVSRKCLRRSRYCFMSGFACGFHAPHQRSGRAVAVRLEPDGSFLGQRATQSRNSAHSANCRCGGSLS